jgi:hypothetical protein
MGRKQIPVHPLKAGRLIVGLRGRDAAWVAATPGMNPASLYEDANAQIIKDRCLENVKILFWECEG